MRLGACLEKGTQHDENSLRILLTLSSPDVRVAVGVRVIFGLADRTEIKWDGSVVARGGHIAAIEPWGFEGSDAVQGNSWTASTHTVRLFRGLLEANVQLPVVANGVVVYLDDANENTVIDFTTAQGMFQVGLNDIPYGKVVKMLNDRVMLDRIPPFMQFTTSLEEQDYPVRRG